MEGCKYIYLDIRCFLYPAGSSRVSVSVGSYLNSAIETHLGTLIYEHSQAFTLCSNCNNNMQYNLVESVWKCLGKQDSTYSFIKRAWNVKIGMQILKQDCEILPVLYIGNGNL